MVSRTKDNIINIYLAYEKLSIYPFCEKGGIDYPNLKTMVY
jgi:hypothetical protein